MNMALNMLLSHYNGQKVACSRDFLDFYRCCQNLERVRSQRVRDPGCWDVGMKEPTQLDVGMKEQESFNFLLKCLPASFANFLVSDKHCTKALGNDPC